jgi:hypothetical protein
VRDKFTKGLDMFKKLLTLLVLTALFPIHAGAVATLPPVTVELLGTSTATQLDFLVYGAVEASDFGSGGDDNNFYIYAPDAEWISGGLANYVRNASDGVLNTAPEVGSYPYSILNNAEYALGNQFVATGWEDAIQIRYLSTDILVGDYIDWAFSVKYCSSPSCDFSPLLGSGLGLSHQIASGPMASPPPVGAVPEPTVIALFALGLVGIGFARRRQS